MHNMTQNQVYSNIQKTHNFPLSFRQTGCFPCPSGKQVVSPVLQANRLFPLSFGQTGCFPCPSGKQFVSLSFRQSGCFSCSSGKQVFFPCPSGSNEILYFSVQSHYRSKRSKIEIFFHEIIHNNYYYLICNPLLHHQKQLWINF